MAERLSRSYQRLFEIRLLHHYWLDEGALIFDLYASAEQRARRLLQYDVRPLLQILPSAATQQQLKALNALFIHTKLGAVVMLPTDTQLATSTSFEFHLFVRQAEFYDYTALSLRSQQIIEITHPQTQQIHRFKTQVPVLSNLSGATRGAGNDKQLFLSREFPTAAANDPVEALVRVGNSLRQLNGDQPGASSTQLAADASTVPVFVHQADIPALIPPAGILNAPSHAIALHAELRDDLYALIQLQAQRLDDPDFSFIDNNGLAKAEPPLYQVRFKNRASYWRYRDKNSSQVHSITAEPQPLSFYGQVGTQSKAQPGLLKTQQTGAQITQLISDIFV